MQKSANRFERPAALAVLLFSACGSCGPQQAKPTPIPQPTGSVSDVEGNVYPTIKIGQQEWMVENLKTATYNTGAPIPNVTDMAAWSNLSSPAYSWPDNDATNKDVYGALYNWYAVGTNQLCPAGWTIPSSDIWGTLVDTQGGKSGAGGRLKEVGTALWLAPNAGATNQSGFSARPAGSRDLDGSFVYRGKNAFWWCSDQKLLSLPATAWFWQTTYDNASSVGGQGQLPTGFSVRCMRAAN
jgi:uncharacterized protein (TIGR02145 family)